MKVIKYIKRWNRWRAFSVSSPMHKFLVLAGLRRDLTFDLVPTDDEQKNIQETINRLNK